MDGTDSQWPDITALVDRSLNAARERSIAVVGDYCLDNYLFVGDAESEFSVETGLPVRKVERTALYPGGAGNVAANVAALSPGKVHAIGVVGDDLYGRELRRLLELNGVKTGGLFVQSECYATNVYTKIYQSGTEDPRLDIGSYNRIDTASEDRLLAAVEEILRTVDSIIINQQLRCGIYSERIVHQLAPMLSKKGGPLVVVDSRHFAHRFPGTIRKMNSKEAAGHVDGAPESARDTAQALSEMWNSPLIVTRGEDGCITASQSQLHDLPGIQTPRPNDPVGAGDTFLATAAIALSSGMELKDAAAVANLAASITVGKLYKTGVVKPDELRFAAQRAAYRFHPELAADPEKATLADDTRIEVIRSPSQSIAVHTAVFDHDGTISVLREGWEPVMQTLMIDSILGTSRKRVGDDLRQEIEGATARYISDTTGIQSIEQMQGLVKLIRHYGLIPESEIAEPAEYKRRYLELLDRAIEHRISWFRKGLLTVDDLTIKGAVSFLTDLRERDVTLYLASGSDQQAVEREAQLLGYARLFNGGIFGSVDDVENDPKSIVLNRILDSIGSTNTGNLVTFGDGPVEMRETLRRGGTPIGIASDEVRRYGMNTDKRRRLILAGASYIMGDFAETESLLRVLAGDTL